MNTYNINIYHNINVKCLSQLAMYLYAFYILTIYVSYIMYVYIHKITIIYISEILYLACQNCRT